MIVDVSSFLIAITFIGAALAVTTLVIWLGARSYGYLLYWGGGLAICIPAVAMLALLLSPYSPVMNYAAYFLLLTGIVLIQAAGGHFRTGELQWRFSIPAWIASVVSTGAAFAIGLSGLGVIVLNICCGVLFIATAIEFWRARKEAPGPLIGIATLYVIMAVTFFLCVIPLIQDGTYVLVARQENWAENLNSVTIIAALTGIGALMLVTAQNRATQEQHRQAGIDPLTGLHNRRALFDRAGKAPLPMGAAMIMFDLDHFKAINDTFGHHVGDEVLQCFARVVSDNVRSVDMAARLGGEEFCILLNLGSTPIAYEVADRIRRDFAVAIKRENPSIAATVSAGIALKTVEGETLGTLLKSADDALYRAKASGRNCVQMSPPRLVA